MNFHKYLYIYFKKYHLFKYTFKRQRPKIEKKRKFSFRVLKRKNDCSFDFQPFLVGWYFCPFSGPRGFLKYKMRRCFDSDLKQISGVHGSGEDDDDDDDVELVMITIAFETMVVMASLTVLWWFDSASDPWKHLTTTRLWWDLLLFGFFKIIRIPGNSTFILLTSPREGAMEEPLKESQVNKPSMTESRMTEVFML